MSGPFAKTTQGPPAPTGVDTNKHALIADQLNGIVEMVDDAGNAHCLETMLQVFQAQTALTNVTTAQNLFNINLPAGALNRVNRTLFISGSAIFTTAGTPAITITIKLGAVTLVAILTPAIGAAQTNGQIQFSFVISVASAGSAGTIEAHGSISVQGGASLSVAIPSYGDQNIAVSGAVNLTTALALTAQITSTVTLTSAQLRQALVEVVG